MAMRETPSWDYADYLPSSLFDTPPRQPAQRDPAGEASLPAPPPPSREGDWDGGEEWDDDENWDHPLEEEEDEDLFFPEEEDSEPEPGPEDPWDWMDWYLLLEEGGDW